MNFWHKIPKPIKALSPMRGITDVVFRQMIVKCGKPDVLFTEFVNVDSLFSDGQRDLMKYLKFNENEHPIVAQLWGENPDNFAKAGTFLKDLGFDGIDINLGCSVKKILKKSCCSALINNESLSKKIIQGTKEGSCGLPVSIKTRIGFDEVNTESWMGFLLKQGVSAITVHGRTAAQGYGGKANWEEIAKAVKLRDAYSVKCPDAEETLVIGNGDVQSLEEIIEKYKKYNVDGVMVGRGILADPYFFDPSKSIKDCSKAERVSLFRPHVELFTETYGKDWRIDTLKKVISMYISDFDGSRELRGRLMRTTRADEVYEVLEEVDELD